MNKIPNAISLQLYEEFVLWWFENKRFDSIPIYKHYKPSFDDINSEIKLGKTLLNEIWTDALHFW